MSYLQEKKKEIGFLSAKEIRTLTSENKRQRQLESQILEDVFHLIKISCTKGEYSFEYNGNFPESIREFLTEQGYHIRSARSDL